MVCNVSRFIRWLRPSLLQHHLVFGILVAVCDALNLRQGRRKLDRTWLQQYDTSPYNVRDRLSEDFKIAGEQDIVGHLNRKEGVVSAVQTHLPKDQEQLRTQQCQLNLQVHIAM